MDLSVHNVAGIGDAENDHAFLRLCELSVAVANALPAVKETADFVTNGDHGAGVTQLIELLVADDGASLDAGLTRHHLPLGTSGEQVVALPSYGQNVLVVGPSASGKSTVATRVLEALVEQKYQFCLIDPEGDYETFEAATLIGGPKRPPQVEEVLTALRKPNTNVIVSMTGMPINDRPPFFLSLLPSLLKMRSQTGRPHWLLLDEAHHLLPAQWAPPQGMLPSELMNTLMITVHPEMLSPILLEKVTTVLAVGQEADQTLAEFLKATGLPAAISPQRAPPEGELLLWRRGNGEGPVPVKPYPNQTERRRHRRKYAEGDLPPERSFYFRGVEQQLNLRANNLMRFLELAEGVDDATWKFHLQQHDYSQWFATAIKDDSLTAEARRIENLPNLSPAEGRQLMRVAVERDYTVPASAPLPVQGAS